MDIDIGELLLADIEVLCPNCNQTQVYIENCVVCGGGTNNMKPVLTNSGTRLMLAIVRWVKIVDGELVVRKFKDS